MLSLCEAQLQSSIRQSESSYNYLNIPTGWSPPIRKQLSISPLGDHVESTNQKIGLLSQPSYQVISCGGFSKKRGGGLGVF